MQIGIVGAGSVGAATAFALMMRGVARKITLVDLDKTKAWAEAADIAHAAPFAYANKIKSGTYANLKECEIVIITAGANQKEGESRTDLLVQNVKIFAEIIPQIVRYATDAILLVATNPVDVMTYVTLKLSNFAKEKVIGSGTLLDTARFRTDLGYHLGVSPKSIHAHVLGEHGDSEVLCWDSGDAGSIPLAQLAFDLGRPYDDKIKAQIDDDVRNAAYKIIAGKKATYFGIAGALTRICQAISTNEYAILTVSSQHSIIEGVEDVCISLPCVVGKRGIHQVLKPHLSKQEHLLLQLSAAKIKKLSQEAEKLFD